jgi:hypothetical protein
MFELLKPESPKTKIYILRSLSDKNLCLTIGAKDAAEAKEKANRLVADVAQSVPLFKDNRGRDQH